MPFYVVRFVEKEVEGDFFGMVCLTMIWDSSVVLSVPDVRLDAEGSQLDFALDYLIVRVELVYFESSLSIGILMYTPGILVKEVV